MVDKDGFIYNCLSQGMTLNKAEKIWKKIQSIKGHIDKNSPVYLQLLEYSPQERLKLRQFAAELGYEYTPGELDSIIEAIGIIRENIE